MSKPEASPYGVAVFFLGCIVLIRFLITPAWFTAGLLIGIIAGLGYDRYLEFLTIRKDTKERTDLEKIQERLSKLELSNSFNKHGQK